MVYWVNTRVEVEVLVPVDAESETDALRRVDAMPCPESLVAGEVKANRWIHYGRPHAVYARPDHA